MSQKKQLLGHQKCTFKLEKQYLHIHEMRTFETILSCLLIPIRVCKIGKDHSELEATLLQKLTL